MEDYNDLSSVDPNQKLLWNEEITFPLIYPELEDFFPKRLETLLLYPSFEKYSNQMMKHTIIVSCCENGKTALTYYENWKLKLATYVSAWTKNHKTIKGKYPLSHSSIYRRSRRYNRAPMPYSLNIHWGYFLHQWRSNGNPQSHGCIRVPGLYIKWLYEHLPRSYGEAIIILEDLYTPTLKKIGNKNLLTNSGFFYFTTNFFPLPFNYNKEKNQILILCIIKTTREKKIKHLSL